MRPSVDEYFMNIAILISLRGTCARRKVGSVIINSKHHVLATGYNGVAQGLSHCVGSNKCPGASYPSGEGLDKCEAIHGEQNALLQCRDVFNIETIYITASPCVTCTKLLLNTSCERIVFLEAYPHDDAKKLWESAGREWTQYVDDKDTKSEFDI